jgi:predicted nuclease of restriction endonuclease-like (RecB) superfamily
MKEELIPANESRQLFLDIQHLIEEARISVRRAVNSRLVALYWHVGKRINDEVLQNERAPYGEQLVENLSAELVAKFGRNFTVRSLRRMMQFAEVFPDFQIVSTVLSQLSWSHFLQLLPIEKEEKRFFYAQKIAAESWSVRFTHEQIERKVYERTQLGNLQVSVFEPDSTDTFKDPYFLDFLGLKDGYLENDLESAILKELELFILELGVGFSFVERQKRMIIDGRDFYLDLLFYHRRLQRLVAIELKLGAFKAEHKGQMELYLRWLDRYDRQEGEKPPIGLILCAEASREQVELLEMHKDGIVVAEYWTELPPKALLEQKIHAALAEAKERLARKKLLP